MEKTLSIKCRIFGLYLIISIYEVINLAYIKTFQLLVFLTYDISVIDKTVKRPNLACVVMCYMC